jgi:diacylglycerol O-acyltransferase / trehalose O-mycolyltransferase
MRTPRPGLRRLAMALLLAVATSALAITPSGAQGALPPGELDPALDNADPVSREACADTRSPAGSLITRRLPDGPRLADGTLAFRSGICVYLPPGYDDGTLRYPVLYLLHGGGGYQHDWVTQGAVQRILDELVAEDPANATIVVMPDGTFDAAWQDHHAGAPLNRTYVVEHLIPYVDATYRTIPDRSARAIAGLSQGGAGAARLASQHPDAFVAAAPMSAAFPFNTFAASTRNPTAPSGAMGDVRHHANDPTALIDNLDPVELSVIYGRTCGDAATPTACATYGGAYAFEHVCCSNEVYGLRLQQVRRTPYEFHAVVGGHDWHYWRTWLRGTSGAFVLRHLADPLPVDAALPTSAAPASFRYRTIRPSFEIFGYDVAVTDRPATEFLALTDVTADGLTARGSGTATVTTADRYEPGTRYAVSGTGTDLSEVVADESGRLTVEIDLGPGHTADQYTAEALAAEAAAAGGYWTTRTVTIAPAP